MQEFQERNVFFDSTPLADADDYCRCRDWCVEDYDLSVWQPQRAADSGAAAVAEQRCAVASNAVPETAAQTAQDAHMAARFDAQTAPARPRRTCGCCGNGPINDMSGVWERQGIAPAPAAPAPQQEPQAEQQETWWDALSNAQAPDAPFYTLADAGDNEEMDTAEEAAGETIEPAETADADVQTAQTTEPVEAAVESEGILFEAVDNISGYEEALVHLLR